jgi:pimeloyl-ACP methyl ester carboxylesterase
MKMNVFLAKACLTVMFVFLTVVLLISIIAVIIMLRSSGSPGLYMDKSGNILPESISEKSFIDVNGSKLGVFIKGKNGDNPVLLYLHGGMPDYFLTERFPTGLDEIFTVVWLDQRGAGISYGARFQDKKINIDDLISDTKEVTDYLRKRFSQDRIYLMAHSGGTYLGIKVIDKYPELFTAYIGVAQIVYQKLSEKKAYEYMIEKYKDNPQRQRIYTQLLLNPVQLSEPIPDRYTQLRDYAMHDLGVGTMRNMRNVITGIFVPSLLFKEYTVREKLNLWKGKSGSGISVIWNELIAHDLSKENVSFKIPVYFFHGIYDYTCSYELAKEYCVKINAPDKGFFSFENSAHSPIFEEPLECIKVIKEFIIGKTP